MNEILEGYSYGYSSKLYCEDTSVRQILRDLADDISKALANGEPIGSVEFRYGQKEATK